MMRITLQYSEGCPNWKTTNRNLAELLDEGWDATVEHELIESYEQAVERRSPVRRPC